MPIPFTCPNCGLDTFVRDERAGQTGACSECGELVSIPTLDRTNPYQSPQIATASVGDLEPRQSGLAWLLFSVEGRITRRPWWYVSIFVFAVYWGYLNEIFISFWLGGLPVSAYSIAILTLALIATAFVTWIDVAVTCKRFHDLDKSGWWYLIRCIPYFGHLWILIECGFMPGTDGPSRFGVDRT